MPPSPPPSLDVRRAEGKALREHLPRREQARAQRPDGVEPLEVLQAAVAPRLPHLLPHRWGRMAQSPFYFFRGNAALMARDLGPSPATGLTVQLCGDAHLMNLGAYAAPTGDLLFDLNDFDEACRGPWEWDLKRLVVSVVLAGRESGHGEGEVSEATRACSRAYRHGLRHFAELPRVELAREVVAPRSNHGPLAPVFEKARRDTPQRLREKALEPGPRFRTKGPFLRPLEPEEALPFLRAFADYADTLPAGRRQVLEGYAPLAFGQRVAGCGSLGVLDVLAACEGNGPEDLLFLEFKAQSSSAWKAFLPDAPPEHEGRRAAEAQQRMQTWSDPFLGWTRAGGQDFLVKQWSDHKAGIEVADLGGGVLEDYAELCGRILAKAHAHSGDPGCLGGYVGQSDELDQALAAYATAYADQCSRDWEALREAIRVGRLPSAEEEGLAG